jgi:hypothetical protein
MPRQRFMHTLVTALAFVALAAPTALARPGGPASPEASDATARSERVQDLRRLNAGNSIRTSSLAGTNSKTPAVGHGPVYWSYDYEAGRPATHSANADDGTPWTTIGVGLAGAFLLAGGAAAIVGRIRLRARRARLVG